MKTKVTLILILVYNTTFAQSAIDFFPSAAGFKWKYKVTPLDTLGNPVEQLSFIQIDTFSNIQTYQGKYARTIFSKIAESTQYFDTNYIHLETTNGWKYTKLFYGMDSIPFLDSLGLTKFFKNFIGWHSYFRFAQPINVEYTIVSRDTTIILNNTSYPIRVKITGKRLNDQNINIPAGNFNCKKFLISYSINYLIFTFELPIILIPDTNWIANSIWVVKKISPPIKIDLSALNLGKYFINGILSELYEYNPVSVQLVDNYDYKIYQNYPNPFNNSTVIRYQISQKSIVKIDLFTINGEFVRELVNNIHTQGLYEIKLYADNLPSGVYIYRFHTNNISETKKLLLIK